MIQNFEDYQIIIDIYSDVQIRKLNDENFEIEVI